MPNDVPRLRYYRPRYGKWQYHWLMKTLQNTLAQEISDIAQFRYHCLNHYYRYGLKPTLDAFNIGKSTLYDWKKSYESSKKRIISLVPKSTAPDHVRRMNTNWRLVEFIREMRKDYGNVGKNIIKYFLDVYARELGVKSIGLTTIGKLIKRRHLTFEERIHIRRQFKFKKLRTRRSPKVTSPGFIQMDSIVVYINHKRHLFMSVMDIFTKFALVEYVPCLSAKQAKEVLIKFQKINPTRVNTVQTDNGSEFLNVFHKYLDDQKIIHKFIYPKQPRINGFIERFNRTIQEEMILRNDEIYYDLSAFKEKLTKYLLWYNTQRPHSALNYMPPLTFIQTKIPECG